MALLHSLSRLCLSAPLDTFPTTPLIPAKAGNQTNVTGHPPARV